MAQSCCAAWIFWHLCSFLIAFHRCWVDFIVLLDHVPPGETAGEEPGSQLPGVAWPATQVGFWAAIGRKPVRLGPRADSVFQKPGTFVSPCCDLSDTLNWTWESSKIFQRI